MENDNLTRLVKCLAFDCPSNRDGQCAKPLIDLGENGACRAYMVPQLDVLPGGKAPVRTQREERDPKTFVTAAEMLLSAWEHIEIAYKHMERFHRQSVNKPEAVCQNLLGSVRLLRHVAALYHAYLLASGAPSQVRVFALRASRGIGSSPRHEARAYALRSGLPPAFIFVFYDASRHLYHWDGKQVRRVPESRVLDFLRGSASP